MAKFVPEAFVRALQAKSGYQVVTAAGPDGLRVRPSISNRYVNAADTMPAQRSRNYAVSAGQMTLVAELFDAESGQVLTRVIDRREARRSGSLTMIDTVSNALGGVVGGRSLYPHPARRLDKAHDIGKK